MTSSSFLFLVIGCALVTWLPRILPFTVADKLVFPEKVNVFLSYLPLCILTALLIQSLLNFRQGQWPTIKLPELVACLPALVVGYYTKDLMKIVIVGIIGIALLRFLLGVL
ncbi:MULTISPECIES: AzlD domain-containing protein [Enterococcus]|uniref:Branched-chain amino acid ABC transporter n=1 Tax=Enterococcus diestrammenae TaxID=1155073 RepID=A0ABV0F2Z4_9ENTE|nr:AzlD domain-containing protein [Enterococcus diestrammenae]KAF1298932.1 branched-chain amino acid ABC transporter [Enterococcus diestrammenae]HIX71143.1 AzlD domain-containing protein [Candidatus Enterococcus stercoravium]